MSSFLTIRTNPISIDPSALPYDAEVEYIQFTGTQYIDTLVKPTNHFTEIKYYVPTYVNDGHILGTSSGASYYHWTEYNNGTQKYFWGKNGSEGNGGSWTSAPHIVEMNKGSNYQVILDGTTLGSGYQIYSSTTLWIGRRDSTTNFQGYIYYCKIYDKSTNTLIHDFIPVRKDQVGYLYDKVSGQLFGNEGSGTISYGPDVSSNPSSNNQQNINDDEPKTHILVGKRTNEIIAPPAPPVSMKIRYLKWQIDSMGQTDGHIQISKLVFLDNNGNEFQWPTSSISLIDKSSTVSIISNQDPTKLFDGSTSTKWCSSFNSTLPFYITFDLGSDDVFDLLAYPTYQIWTGDDTATFGRNPSGWKLYGSSDNSNWTLIDEVTNYTMPLQNKSLGYEGRTQIAKYDAEVEYIESTGTQWIDLGITPTNKTVAQMKVYNVESTGDVVFGYYNGSDSTDWRFFNAGEYAYWDCYNGRVSLEAGWTSGSWREFEIGNNYVKDLETGSNIVTGSTIGTFTGTRTITLNNYYNSSFSKNKWAYVKVFEDGELILDLIPVRIGQVGYMYDKISKKLFENQGSGSFVCGDDIPDEHPSSSTVKYIKWQIASSGYKDAYVEVSELKFIDGDGNSYSWPAATDVVDRSSHTSDSASNESVYKLIDGYTSTKWCVNTQNQYPFYVTFYLGNGNSLDLSQYSKYQIWTTSDSGNGQSGRLPTGWTLYGSNDREEWTILDEVEVCTMPSQSQVLGYEGTIQIATPEPVISGDYAVITALKKHINFKVNVHFDSDGGTSCGDQTFIFGEKYSELPVPTKTQNIFNGWRDANGNFVTESDNVQLSCTSLTADWEYVNIDSDCTEYIAQVTASYKKTGIYSATRYSSTSAIYVDWGDGSVEKIDGSISQLAHEYANAGTYHVKVSNNTTSFNPSYNNSTWYSTTSQNQYTFKDIVKTGSRCGSMDNYAFCYCQALSSINFLSSCYMSMSYIPSYCFYYCSGIPTLSTLPSRIKYPSTYAFYSCTGLTGVQDLRNTGLTSLPNQYAFGYCSNVREWKLPDTLVGTYFGTYLFQNNTNLSAINLPSSLTAISQNCFYSCQNLKSITIPSKVAAINSYAFGYCYQLSSVDYQTTALTSIQNNAFYYCYNLRDLNVPNTVKYIGNQAFYYCYSTMATDVHLPSSLTSLGTYVYYNDYNLKTLEIPSSLQSIGDYAFAGCRALSSIVDNRLTAQTIQANTFGNAAGTGSNAYTGYNTRGSNILCTYVAAEGFDTSYWNDPLQNADKCGYNIGYIDPENLHYCTITLNAGAGSVSPNQLCCIQGKKIGTIPDPTPPSNKPYFMGWFTQTGGQGDKYTNDSIVPSNDTLELYAYYVKTPPYTYTVDLNDEWRDQDPNTNPDTETYNGVYESDKYHGSPPSSGCVVKMYIDVTGYTTFDVYIRSNGENGWSYAIACNPDVDPGTYSDAMNNAAADTNGNATSTTTIDGYTQVTYNLDGGSHRICICYIHKDSYTVGDDRGYVLIPKPPASPVDENAIYMPDLDDNLEDEQHEDTIDIETEEE